MYEFTSKEFRYFYYGPVNLEAERQYLMIARDEEEAVRNSALAVVEENLTEIESAHKVARMQSEIRKVFNECRRESLCSMNYDTVLFIARKLNLMNVIADPGLMTDATSSPQAAAVVDRCREIMGSDWLEAYPAEKSRIASILVEADERTGVPRPLLPCDLHDALRYAGNCPAASWETLQEAFEAFLRHTPIPAQEAAMATRPGELEIAIGKSTRAIDSLKRFKELDPASNTPKIDQIELQNELDSLKKYQSELDGIQEIVRFRESYNPRKRVPLSVKNKADKVFELYWACSGCFEEKPSTRKKRRPSADVPVSFVYNEAMLAWIAEKFHSFWQNHGEYFEKKRRKSVPKNEQLSAKRDEAGVGGREIREYKRWVGRSKSLVEYLGKRTFGSLRQDELKDFLTTFSKDHLRVGKPTRPKIQNFFGTLWTHSRIQPTSEIDLGIIQSILISDGIKNVTLPAISTCLETLGVTLPPLAKKRSKKN